MAMRAMRGVIRPEQPGRRIDRPLAWFAASILALTAAGVALGQALLFRREAPPEAVVVAVGETRASVPGRWLRSRSGSTASLLLMPADLGLEAEEAPILVHLVPADDAMDPADRPALLYARLLSPEAMPSPGELIRREFRPGTPYEGEVLYLAPPDGRSFSARCAATPLPGQAECATAFRIGAMEAILGLPLALVPHGPAIVARLTERLGGR